jgi:hypothetical protein
MPEAKRTVRVFYSWQSDLPDDCNKNAIRQALRTAAKRVGKAMPDLKVIVDEATRGVSGSPNIVFKILEKILAAEMVVADISTVHATGTRRASPNPNVLFEVGYAVAELGWERVILLFNEEWGHFLATYPSTSSRTGRAPIA